MAAVVCGFCHSDIGHLSRRGQQTHIGLCANAVTHTSSSDAASTAPEDFGAGSQDGGDVPPPAVAHVPHALPLDPEGFEAAEEVGTPEPSYLPFLSAADADLARLYVNKFDLAVGTLDAILEITRTGDLKAGSVRDLLDVVDALPGMEFHPSEVHIAGYPDACYRLFYRRLRDAVDLLLRKHARELLLPSLLPPDEEGTRPVSEMWQAGRYQHILGKFREVAEPSDVLLPLIFFSGMCMTVMYVCMHALLAYL